MTNAVESPLRRILLAGGLYVGLGGVVSAANAAPASGADLSKVTLRIATYKGGWRAMLGAAGLLDTPYKVEWRELNNGVLHIEALNGDALDLGSGSEIPALFAARQKANVRFVAAVHEDLHNQVTLARKDAPIQSIADLKGKRVGYVRATTTHYFLARQLAEVGLSFNDITAINLSPSDGLSAFDRGELDAWAIYGYNGQIARIKYGARVLKTGKGYLSGNWPIYANANSVADPLKAAALADYLVRLRQAYLWANSHFLEYARAQSAETRVPVGDIIELWNNRSHDYGLSPVDDKIVAAHQAISDSFLKLGVLDGPADVAPLWDRRFTDALRKGPLKRLA